MTAKECPSKILQLSDLWLRAFLPYAIKSKDSEYVLLALHTLLKQEESGRVTDSKLSVKSASWLLKEDNFDASVFESAAQLLSASGDVLSVLLPHCSEEETQMVVLPVVWELLKEPLCVKRLCKLAERDATSFANVLLFASKQKKPGHLSQASLASLRESAARVRVDDEELRTALTKASTLLNQTHGPRSYGVMGSILLVLLMLASLGYIFLVQK